MRMFTLGLALLLLAATLLTAQPAAAAPAQLSTMEHYRAWIRQAREMQPYPQ